MSLPFVSILVPVYNVEHYLPQCLDSLLSQTLKDIEIVCVNDGSTDNSLQVLNEYAARDERIIVLDQPNAGVSVARNNALKHVKGEYYMFLDSDDWLEKDTCEVAYNAAKQKDADCVMFSYVKEFGDHSVVNHIFEKEYIIWESEEVKKNFHRRLFGPIGDELGRPQDMDIIVSPCMQLFKTEKYVNVPFVDIREVGTFEDGLYQMDIYADCNRFIYIDKPFYHYRKTNSTSITTKYKPDLLEKTLHRYDIMDSYIIKYNLGEEYRQALQNRVAIGTLGLGLNEIKAPNVIKHNVFGYGMVKVLNNGRIRDAVLLLNIKEMPLAWRVFYFMAKHKMSFSLSLMLVVIEFLRSHKK